MDPQVHKLATPLHSTCNAGCIPRLLLRANNHCMQCMATRKFTPICPSRWRQRFLIEIIASANIVMFSVTFQYNFDAYRYINITWSREHAHSFRGPVRRSVLRSVRQSVRRTVRRTDRWCVRETVRLTIRRTLRRTLQRTLRRTADTSTDCPMDSQPV